MFMRVVAPETKFAVGPLAQAGGGFSWLASGNMPFTIEHRFSTDGLSSALSLLGYIGRLDLSGDLHYTEGTAASE